MVEDIVLEQLASCNSVLTDGIALTIFEFKKMMKDDEKIKKAKSIKNSKR